MGNVAHLLALDLARGVAAPQGGVACAAVGADRIGVTAHRLLIDNHGRYRN